MEQTFYCVYSGQTFSESERSKEHIIPFSIGGSDLFVTNDVSKKANNKLGSIVDKDFSNIFFINAERNIRGIKSQKKNIPDIEIIGTSQHFDKPVKLRISHEGGRELTVAPEVNSDWSNGKFTVSCSPDDLPGILNNLKRKANKKGISLDELSTSSKRIEEYSNIKVEVEEEFDISCILRFFVKTALATSHFVFGESWSKCECANQLRNFLWDKNVENINEHKIKGSIFPFFDNSNFTSVFYRGDDLHIVAILNIEPVVFYCLLFGKYPALINISDKIWKCVDFKVNEGVVFTINSKTREYRKYDYSKFVCDRPDMR